MYTGGWWARPGQVQNGVLLAEHHHAPRRCTARQKLSRQPCPSGKAKFVEKALLMTAWHHEISTQSTCVCVLIRIPSVIPVVRCMRLLLFFFGGGGGGYCMSQISHQWFYQILLHCRSISSSCSCFFSSEFCARPPWQMHAS